MSAIDMIYVQSSNVEAIGFDADNEELYVSFLKGGTYVYSGVPQGMFDDFLNAPSKGTYLDQNIKKGGFAYRRL